MASSKENNGGGWEHVKRTVSVEVSVFHSRLMFGTPSVDPVYTYLSFKRFQLGG